MKPYIQLTLAQLRLFGRNRQVLFWTLFFPVVFIFMLGTFMGNGSGGAVEGYWIDEDGSERSAQVLAALEEQKAVLKLEQAKDREAALEELRHGTKQVLIIIPAGFGDTVEAAVTGQHSGVSDSPAGSLTVYYDQTQASKSMSALNAAAQAADEVSKAVVEYSPVVAVEPVGVQSLNLTFLDFIVPGIVAMMIMSNNLNGVAGQIASWRERGILRRMQSTPLRPSTFIAAQITARLLMNGSQALIVLLLGIFVFGAQMNGSWLLLLGFVLLGTLAFMAIGFIIAGLARTPESAGPIAGFVSFPLLFLGGIFFPVSDMPAFMQPIVKAIPITHLSTGLRQVMNVGAGIGEVWVEALVLGGWLAAAFIAASLVFKWE
ncbi:ABC transporter permease [Paenibacillus sambharensis]|uniref:ABC transporter permease n=1 Tax=Paenibacillus sambharensis TaxID=1803190 RepID=A0A2W1LS99_9BACL|nr:ABC transporter permease [Paenibacillus sambharensis]PZD94711.1 ABC transporter permease [Paenibacillus sambharensis]